MTWTTTGDVDTLAVLYDTLSAVLGTAYKGQAEMILYGLRQAGYDIVSSEPEKNLYEPPPGYAEIPF